MAKHLNQIIILKYNESLLHKQDELALGLIHIIIFKH